MIKAHLQSPDGKPMFLFGLTDRNLQLLREKHPLVVPLETLGGPSVSVAIMWGSTEQAIVDELREGGVTDLPSTPIPQEEQFPRGKVRPNDEGALMGSMRIQDTTLFLDFPKPVSWLALGLHELDVFIATLQQKREQLAKLAV